MAKFLNANDEFRYFFPEMSKKCKSVVLHFNVTDSIWVKNFAFTYVDLYITMVSFDKFWALKRDTPDLGKCWFFSSYPRIQPNFNSYNSVSTYIDN
jgi:hypothetical protein